MSVTTEHRDRPHLRPVDPVEDLGRTPPQDLDAEMAVLGACMLSKTALEDVLDTITPADFYRPAHELVLAAAVHLYVNGDPVDTITVSDELTKRGELGRVGGASYLHTLISSVPTAANAGYYARIVRRKARRRRLVEAGTKIVQLGYLDTDDTGEDDDIDDLVTAAQAEITSLPPAALTGTNQATSTWAPVNLTAVLNGTHAGPRATLLRRRDSKCLLYPGAVHSVSGEPGSGKTWTAVVALAQELEVGNDVAMLDFEDRAETICDRLVNLGVAPATILKHFRYIRPDTAITTAARTALAEAVTSCSLVVIDGITEAMTMHGLSLMDNEDVARWLALIPRHLADQGPAVLQIDHVVKNADQRGRYAIGGQHKLAGITGVAYKMLTIKSFGKGCKGHAKLVIDKDKHGDVGPNGATAADVHLDATGPDGTLYAWLDTPGNDTTEDGTWRPTGYMEKVSRYLEASPGTTGRGITDAVKGTDKHIRTALAHLVTEGYVRTEDGPNRAVFHHSIKPFREDDQ